MIQVCFFREPYLALFHNCWCGGSAWFFQECNHSSLEPVTALLYWLFQCTCLDFRITSSWLEKNKSLLLWTIPRGILSLLPHTLRQREGKPPSPPGVRGQQPAALLTQLPAERVAQDPWVTGTGCLQSNVPLIFICYFFFSFLLLAGTADF